MERTVNIAYCYDSNRHVPVLSQLVLLTTQRLSVQYLAAVCFSGCYNVHAYRVTIADSKGDLHFSV